MIFNVLSTFHGIKKLFTGLLIILKKIMIFPISLTKEIFSFFQIMYHFKLMTTDL